MGWKDKTAGQDCRARLPGKNAGQDCRARLSGKTAGKYQKKEPDIAPADLQ
jgi:hypothetical protein